MKKSTMYSRKHPEAFGEGYHNKLTSQFSCLHPASQKIPRDGRLEILAFVHDVPLFLKYTSKKETSWRRHPKTTKQNKKEDIRTSIRHDLDGNSTTPRCKTYILSRSTPKTWCHPHYIRWQHLFYQYLKKETRYTKNQQYFCVKEVQQTIPFFE
ncbi:unnamed protein product [Ectocarpus sp. 8 AP-2014]